jgi:hypothetical protein
MSPTPASQLMSTTSSTPSSSSIHYSSGWLHDPWSLGRIAIYVFVGIPALAVAYMILCCCFFGVKAIAELLFYCIVECILPTCSKRFRGKKKARGDIKETVRPKLVQAKLEEERRKGTRLEHVSHRGERLESEIYP